MSMKNKVVLLTGLNGFGIQLSKEILKQGALLCLADVNTGKGNDLVKKFEGSFGKNRILFIPTDVTDFEAFDDAFQTVMSRFGHIDILINNAEIKNDNLWELAVDVNLNGVIRGIILAKRYMKEGGIVVNIGSSSSLTPYISSPIYTATKHAILGLTKASGLNQTKIKILAFCIESPKSDFVDQSHGEGMKKETNGVHFSSITENMVKFIFSAASGSLWLFDKDKPMEIPYSSSGY